MRYIRNVFSSCWETPILWVLPYYYRCTISYSSFLRPRILMLSLCYCLEDACKAGSPDEFDETSCRSTYWEAGGGSIKLCDFWVMVLVTKLSYDVSLEINGLNWFYFGITNLGEGLTLVWIRTATIMKTGGWNSLLIGLEAPVLLSLWIFVLNIVFILLFCLSPKYNMHNAIWETHWAYQMLNIVFFNPSSIL